MKKTKRLSVLFLSILMLLTSTNVFATRHEKRDIPLNGIIVNDHIVYSDVYPYIKNNRTYVPIRFIAEELGYDVKWDGNNKKVTMNQDDTTVELKIGSNQMLVNGKNCLLDAPADIRDDRTFVPLRVIAEAFGEKVDYSEDYKAVYIGQEPKYNKNYKVVYYYENMEPYVSKYTINIATYKITLEDGSVQRFETIKELVSVVYEDFYNFKEYGVSKYGVTSYNASINYIKKEEPNKQVEKFKSDVKKEKQLRDEYYVNMADDHFVGTWYGPSFMNWDSGKEDMDRYMYITSLGNGKYLIKNRDILPSDNSQVFTEQYAYFDKNINALVVDSSHKTYGGTGRLSNNQSYSYATTYYLENNNKRLSWGQKGSQYYCDKY